MAVKILESLLNVKMIKNKKYNWLKNPNTNYLLELDAYNEKLKIAVEYQGVQHFKTKNGYFGGKEALVKRQKHDEIKRKICKEKGILLLEPNYKMDEEDIKYYYLEKINSFIKT